MARNFTKIKLSDRQIRGVACIVYHEQGDIPGWYAEASQIYNLTLYRYGMDATGDDVEKLCKSGWYAKGKERFDKGTDRETIINIVKNVICYGHPILPLAITEHDCLSDISKAMNGSENVRADRSKYRCNVTKIYNKMSAVYTFYCFPGGYSSFNDPFGCPDQKYRKKVGENFYTIGEAKRGKNQIPLKCSQNKKAIIEYLKNNYKYTGDLNESINMAVQTEICTLVDGRIGPKSKQCFLPIYPGTESTLITLLEMKLYLIGINPYGINGVYPEGSKTGDAIKLYQKKKRISVDGIAGQETLYLLFNEKI